MLLHRIHNFNKQFILTQCKSIWIRHENIRQYIFILNHIKHWFSNNDRELNMIWRSEGEIYNCNIRCIFMFGSDITLITSRSCNVIKRKCKCTLNTIAEFPYQKNVRSHTCNSVHIFQCRYKKHLLHRGKPGVGDVMLSVFY